MASWLSRLRTLQDDQSETGLPAQAQVAPWQQQLLDAIDWERSSGDAWKTIGREGVLGYMGEELQKKYGTRNLADFRYVEDANVPGGYRLDWPGQKTPTAGLVNAMRNRSLQTGLVGGASAGDAGDGSPITMGNAAENLTFGATWEGKGGTDFNFYRKPDGSVGIRTGSQKSNDTADILTAAAVVGGGILGGQFLGGMTGGGAAAAEAAAAGAADLGMAGFGQIGIPSAIPAGAGFGTIGTAGLPAVSTYGAGFGGGAIGSGLAGTLSAMGAGGTVASAGPVPVVGGGGGGGGAAGGGATSVVDKLGSLTTGSKLGDMLLSSAASSVIGKLMTPDMPEIPKPATVSEIRPESITKAVSAMPDPLEQKRARRRSLTEQLGRRGRASTIMTRPGGRLGG